MTRVGAAGIGWAIAATGLGCLHLIAAGAPIVYPAVNAVAGFVALLVGGGLAGGRVRRSAALPLAAGGAMLATALFGTPVEGIARWVALGPLRLQPGLILMPLLLIGFARRSGWAEAGGLAAGLVALGLQPDRGTAGAAALALVALAAIRRQRAGGAMAVLALVMFGWTLMRPDPLSGVRFVEGVFAAAMGQPATMALLAAGTIAMLAPAGWRLWQRPRDGAGIAFAALWAGLLGAAAVAAYPTPVLGYGASGVIGFVLATLLL